MVLHVVKCFSFDMTIRYTVGNKTWDYYYLKKKIERKLPGSWALDLFPSLSLYIYILLVHAKIGKQFTTSRARTSTRTEDGD